MKESEEIKLYNRIKQFIYDRSAKEEPPGMQILHRMNDDDIRNKLLEFQMENITITKDGINPHFKSSYSTVNEVLSKVRKPLNDLGILILQTPEKEGLRTQLIDTEDDSEVSCFMPYVEISTAQKLGSCNTYNRRYSLVTLLGLEDEDDDGNVASERKPKIAKHLEEDDLDF